MASTREERMQQRLRGAQRRNVKNVDFGLMFPPILAQSPAQPTPIRRSPRRSLDLAPQSLIRPTPRAQSQPPIATSADESIRPVTTLSTVDANTSAKRRKLDSDEPSTSRRGTRSSYLALRQDIYALHAEDELVAPANSTNSLIRGPADLGEAAELDTSAAFVSQRSEKTPSPQIGEVEITESPSHAPGSGHRTRIITTAAMQSSQLQDELQIEPLMRPERLRSPTTQIKRKRAPSVPDAGRSRRSRVSVSSASIDLDLSRNEVDELSPYQPRRGRRRRSSIQGEPLEELVIEESADEKEAAEEIEDPDAVAILKEVKGGRRISRQAPAAPSPDLDYPSEQPVLVAKNQHSRLRQAPILSPSRQSHLKNSNSKAPKPSKKNVKKQFHIGSPIPVTTYRLTKRATYDEDESDADILSTELPYSKRGGVNAVDVLSQVCHEVISSSLDTIQEHGRNTQDKVSRREFRDKQRFVEAFGRELHTRLLEHTINLDYWFSLEKRVREEQNKKLALREDVLKIRAEREQVALRMDEIRMRHELESKDAQELDKLNTAIHDIELAVERGKEKHPQDPAIGPVEIAGVELLLKRVASETSNNSESGGILKQIKEFNAFLERAALALEGREARK